jgi:hypothetical protein
MIFGFLGIGINNFLLLFGTPFVAVFTLNSLQLFF